MVELRKALISLLILCCAVSSISQIGVVKAEPETVVVPDDFASIQAAVDYASEGDTVFVKSGTYSENLTINKSLSLVGEDKETTIVVGEGNTALLVRHDNVTVTGFTFKRPSTMRWYYGIHLLSVKQCNVFGNIVESTFYGIWLFDASFNNVYQNNCTRDYHGIYLGNSNHNNISRNHATSNAAVGIGAGGSDSNIITGNYVASNDWAGIDLDGGNPNCDNLIAENVVTHNGDIGIGITSINSTSNRIVDNTITENGNPEAGDVAIRLGWDNNLVERNHIIGNQSGIYIEGSSNSTIRWNWIESNPEGGIRIHSFPTRKPLNNVIYENNLINNSVVLSGLPESSKVNIWDIDSRGNYWSGYSGQDNDGDGIGDTPYNIGQNNTDNYPLMEPVNTEVIPEFPSSTIITLVFVLIMAVTFYKKKLTEGSQIY